MSKVQMGRESGSHVHRSCLRLHRGLHRANVPEACPLRSCSALLADPLGCPPCSWRCWLRIWVGGRASTLDRHALTRSRLPPATMHGLTSASAAS